MIIYVIFLHWIQIRGLRVSLSLNRGLDHSVLLDLVFRLVIFNWFHFQTLFSNILDFQDFLEFFRIILQRSSKSVSIGIAGRFQEF